MYRLRGDGGWGKRGFWFFLEKFNLYIKFIKNRFRFFFGKIIWIRIMSINLLFVKLIYLFV